MKAIKTVGDQCQSEGQWRVSIGDQKDNKGHVVDDDEHDDKHDRGLLPHQHCSTCTSTVQRTHTTFALVLVVASVLAIVLVVEVELVLALVLG